MVRALLQKRNSGSAVMPPDGSGKAPSRRLFKARLSLKSHEVEAAEQRFARGATMRHPMRRLEFCLETKLLVSQAPLEFVLTHDATSSQTPRHMPHASTFDASCASA